MTHRNCWWTFAAILLSLAGPFGVHATDYLSPKILTATIYEYGTQRVLFTFKRTATESNSTIHVLREYMLTNGTVVARERVTYQAGKLSAFQLEELQAGLKGSATVRGDKIFFEFNANGERKSNSEKLQNDVLTGDMVAPFITDHWKELMSGEAAKCRLIAPSRRETVGFKFVKESETTWRGKRAVVIRMEPSSFIIAQFIDPLRFTMEKGGEHHIFQYTGRITPSISKKGKWEDTDALTVFDWK